MSEHTAMSDARSEAATTRPEPTQRDGATRRLTQSRVWPLVQPVFSAGVWASSFALMGVTGAACLALEPLVPYRKSHHYLGGPGLGTCVKLTGAKLSVTYHEDFDPERRGVFAQNHVNVFDGNLACNVIPHAFCGLMVAWHFKIPGYGWIMRIAGSIPVYPHKEGRTHEMSEMAKLRAAEGMSILVFPEGHRTTDGKVHTYRRGVFFMARDAGLPVVPIGVRGAYEVNRKGTWKFTPGPIDVFVGPQFETAGLDEAGITRLARRLERMTALYVETGIMPVDDESLGDPEPAEAMA